MAFADFWPNFNKHDNFFQQILKQGLGAEVVDDPAQADVLVYSVFGDTHRSFHGTKVFYTGESVMPRWSECDYALTFLRDGAGRPERHLRLPSWVHEEYVRKTGRIEQLSNEPQAVLDRHRKFCNFVYSNGRAKERVVFLKTLSRYRHVDSPGKLLNNTGVDVRDKVDYCSAHKFTIAFENYPARGYVTAKLPDAFAAGTLPIYWGDPDVGLDFNPKRFVHARDFHHFDELAEHIRYLDGNDEAYLSYFREPLFLENQKSVDDYRDALDLFFRKVLSSGAIQDEEKDEDIPSGVPLRYHRAEMPRYEDGKPWGEDSVTGQLPCIPGDALGPAPLRMAACLFSYKRVEDFLRQIFCMVHQSYPHLHVFAALKGIPLPVVKELIYPYIQPLIDEGKVTLRLFSNKDQVSNFLDTIRGLDVSGFDLFVRIDDDDFYDRDYVQHVVDFHATLPAGYSSCHWGEGKQLHKEDGFPVLRRTSILCMGAAQIVSRRIVEQLLQMETTPSLLKEVMDKCRMQTGYRDVRFAEDQLFKSIMLEHGCGNIAHWLVERQISRHLVVQKSNASVTRGGMVPADLYRIPICLPIKMEESEHILDLLYPHRQGCIRLFGNRAKCLDGSGEEAEVVSFSEKELVLQWKGREMEYFVFDSPEVYRFQPGVESSSKQNCSATASVQDDASSEDEVISLRHAVWGDWLRLHGNRAHRVNCGDGALIAARDETRIVLDWDRWDREEFALRNDGQYYFSPYECQDSDTRESEEWIIDVLDRPGKSWMAHTGRPTLRIRYAMWDMLLHMEDMCRDALAALERRPLVKRILLVGLCKDSLGALHIAQELKRRNPALEIGVLGCPWPQDSSTLESRSGSFWSGAFASCYQQGVFDPLFRRYADPVAMWLNTHKERLNIRGYSFHAEKSSYQNDRACTKRVEPFLHKIFTAPQEENSESKNVHLHVSFFLKKHPVAFRGMIDLLFEDLRHPGPEGECLRYRVREDGGIEREEV